MDADKIRATFLEKFRQVVYERSRTLSDQYEKLIEGADEAIADALMRELHTLKGESRMMGFAAAGQVVHALEDAVKLTREDKFRQLPQLREVFFEVLDSVAAIAGQGASPDPEPICHRITAALEGKAPKPAAKKPKPKKDPSKKQTTSSADSDSSSFELPSMVRISGQDLDRLSDSISDLFSTYLQIQDLGKGITRLRSHASPHQSRDKRKVLDADMLMNSLQSLDRDLAAFHREYRERTLTMATELDLVLDQVRQIRLLPITTLFNVYSSAARDLARAVGKQLQVRIEGETTMVDRSILDALGDMLLHLIRNAIDHGLEKGPRRLGQNKSERGSLWLRAQVVNDRIRIEVEDDGRGIDPGQIRKIALRKGVIKNHEFETLTNQESIELIFAPGFSTAEKTTELSGRGVGMDVVRARLQDLGGAIYVDSTPGQGTRFSIELPTTVAIARVVMFKAAGQTFALLATFVRRVERISTQSLLETSGGRALTVPEGTISAAHANELLRLGAARSDNEHTPVLLLEHGDRRIALLVDELIGEQELTIKPFSPYLSKIQSVSGAATLEDGSLVLLLHAGELISLAGRVHAPMAFFTSQTDQTEQQHRVLLVEDSIITRELERSVLVSFGLLVEEAGDGVEALNLLMQREFDVVVSDVEMPNMDGLELTRRIKQEEATEHLPVILVTTLASDEDKRRGMEAGADGYIVKSEFGSQAFIDLVSNFLPDLPLETETETENEDDPDPQNNPSQGQET
ncbi:MAG: response regulator [Deltaproteobacteria bacterium]|nr:response regulator [Deltaproteobacteria bacterium]